MWDDIFIGKANKGVWRMPRLTEAMKDVISCDMALFEAQYSLDTESKTETVTETKTVRVGESLGLSLIHI